MRGAEGMIVGVSSVASKGRITPPPCPILGDPLGL